MPKSNYIIRLRECIGSSTILLPAARLIVRNSKDGVLLIKRIDFGVWGLPSGSPDEGESMEECIKREAKEETGLEIQHLKVIGFSSDPETEIITYPNGDKVHSFALLFLTSSWSGEIKTSDESEAVEFFSLSSLPEMIPSERLALNKYLEFLTTKKFQLY